MFRIISEKTLIYLSFLFFSFSMLISFFMDSKEDMSGRSRKQIVYIFYYYFYVSKKKNWFLCALFLLLLTHNIMMIASRSRELLSARGVKLRYLWFLYQLRWFSLETVIRSIAILQFLILKTKHLMNRVYITILYWW